MLVDDFDIGVGERIEGFGGQGFSIEVWCDFLAIAGERWVDRTEKTIAERESVGRPIRSVRAGCSPS